MNVLAINSTTSTFLEVAVLRNNKIFYLIKKVDTAYYEDLILLIKKLLYNCRLNIRDLDYLGVCIGPGSFTGIRLGLATMQALAYSIKKALIGFKSLELLAWSVTDNLDNRNILFVIKDAKRDNFYSAIFFKDKKMKEIKGCRLINKNDFLDELKRISKNRVVYVVSDVVEGNENKQWRDFGNIIYLNPSSDDNRAKALIGLTNFYFNKNKRRNILNVQPLYLYSRYCQVHSFQK